MASRAEPPLVAGSTASAGMKWSTVLVTASMGMPTGAVQLLPSDEVLRTMSFDEQPARKRQSCQTTYTRPAASTVADGSAMVLMLPATRWSVMVEIVTDAFHVTPASDE